MLIFQINLFILILFLKEFMQVKIKNSNIRGRIDFCSTRKICWIRNTFKYTFSVAKSDECFFVESMEFLQLTRAFVSLLIIRRWIKYLMLYNSDFKSSNCKFQSLFKRIPSRILYLDKNFKTHMDLYRLTSSLLSTMVILKAIQFFAI